MRVDFSELLSGLSQNSGATAEDLVDLFNATAGTLPDSYQMLLKTSDGVTGWLRERYLIIYSASEAIAVNCAAKINEALPGCFIFASNGGGTSYLIRLSEESPTPVYRCEDVDIGATEPERIAGSIEEFLATFGPAFA